MKKLSLAILICMIFTLVFPLSVSSDSGYELTLVYKSNENSYENLSINVYRLASIEEDGSYALTEAFSAYPINLNGIKSHGEWGAVTETAVSYIIADSIKADYSGVTSEKGEVKFSSLTPGLYLTMKVDASGENATVLFESFITAIIDSDVTACPKGTIHTPNEPSSLKIIKQWKDAGYREKRPESITVDVYNGGEHYTTVTLNASNNWSSTLELSDTMGSWTVVERNVGKNYMVTLEEKNDSFVITNTYKPTTPSQKPPQTGDPFVMWPYLIAMTVSGAGIIFVALLLRRKPQ